MGRDLASAVAEHSPCLSTSWRTQRTNGACSAARSRMICIMSGSSGT